MYADGIQEWVLDSKEVLFRAIPESVTNDSGEKIDGVLGLKFETPFRNKSKK